MAELLGPVNVDYRSPKITDDLIQQGAAVRETEMMNLQSQMMTRGQQADTAAANTASLIQSRISQSNLASRQADLAAYKAGVDADRTYNLIDMNLRQAEREDMKMPYVLEGLAAQNWINHTIAEGNQLENEFADASFGARVEGAALEAKNKLANLNKTRMENQLKIEQNDREEVDRITMAEVQNRLNAGENIDDIHVTFGSKMGNDWFGDTKRLEQGEIAHKAAAAAAAEDARQETIKIGKLSPAQRQAWNIAPDDAARAQLMQDSTETNEAIDRLRKISNAGWREADLILQNRDPVTGVMTMGSSRLVDQDGNLTDQGRVALNAAVRRTADKKQASSPALEAIRLRHQLDQPTTAQVLLAKQKRKDDLVQSFIKSIPDDAGDPRTSDDPDDMTPYTPQRKLEVATEMADALIANPTAQASQTFTSAHEELRAADPAAGVVVDKLKVEAAAINKIIMDWGKTKKAAAFDKPDGTAGAPAMDDWWTGDIDRGTVTRDAAGNLMSSMETSEGWGSTWDSTRDTITALRNEILDKMGPKGEAEMFDITKPHPFALRQWGTMPPEITSMGVGTGPGRRMLPVKAGDAAWAYNKDEPSHDDRWTRVMLVHVRGPKLGQKMSLADLRRKYRGKLISGIDFSDNRGNATRAGDYGRPTPNASTPAAW